MKKLSAMAIMLFLFVFLAVEAPRLALADEKPEPSAIAITADIAIIRPLGIVSLVAGTAVFIVALPFSIPTRSVGVTAKKLIVEPFKFTFTRPVGETREQ